MKCQYLHDADARWCDREATHRAIRPGTGLSGNVVCPQHAMACAHKFPWLGKPQRLTIRKRKSPVVAVVAGALIGGLLVGALMADHE